MGRFPFDKNSGFIFWKFHVPNGTVHAFWLHKLDASHHFSNGYCTCMQVTKQWYLGQQFCDIERDISVRLTEMTRPVKEDHPQSWSPIFQSDQTQMVRSILIYQLKFLEFWVEWKAPMALPMSGFVISSKYHFPS